MKTNILLLTSLCLMTACEEERGPTLFEGKVVYAGSGKPVGRGEVSVSAIRQSLTPGSKIVTFKRHTLGDDGLFSLEFEENERIGFFRIHVSMIKDTVINGEVRDKFDFSYSYNCSPYDCDYNYRPGKSYRDLVIEVSKK